MSEDSIERWEYEAISDVACRWEIRFEEAEAFLEQVGYFDGTEDTSSERTVEVGMVATFRATADVPVSVLQEPETGPNDYEHFVEEYQPSEPWSLTTDLDWRCGHCGQRPRLKHSERPDSECERCGADRWEIAPDEDGGSP